MKSIPLKHEIPVSDFRHVLPGNLYECFAAILNLGRTCDKQAAISELNRIVIILQEYASNERNQHKRYPEASLLFSLLDLTGVCHEKQKILQSIIWNNPEQAAYWISALQIKIDNNLQ